MATNIPDYKTLYLQERDKRIAAQQLVEDKTQVLIAINDELQKKVVALEQHQQWLVQSEKMATLGTLCAGVAHEINNPLSYVMSNIEVIQHTGVSRVALLNAVNDFLHQDMAENELKTILATIDKQHNLHTMSEDLPEQLNEIAEGLKRIKNIVASLLNFAHPGSKDKQLVDITQAANDALKLLNNKIKRCKVSTHFSDVPSIYCHLESINQIFVNLIINAYQACSLNANQEWLIDLCIYANSTHIVIELTDNGCGMSKQTQAKIFDPFYTTKEVGEGTGMGMTLVYAMVNDHGGTIEIKTQLNKGTCICCFLPITQDVDI
ncbi:GHKL domain-containing protein [Pseudoalteromonas sp. MMG010]|uniref:sensor histidine kinase n=1 Tax=Pseudoalteromonas sp. MMG010 TaxID=2822685 RepID=UPI001B39E795|nr:ATP-binding protein [Pseudoalteromonas sp. MMG010]MBQ4833601.1 GHKL domain-containing protein [Pseudoalteromonas sp. MMG010]